MWQDPALTLSLWEQAIGCRGDARDELLLGAMPASLGERNRRALQRYADLFGARVELLGRCPQCGEPVEFDIDVEHCARQLSTDEQAGDAWHQYPLDGSHLRFRLPLASDLHALAGIEDTDAFAEALLARCVEGPLPASDQARDAICRHIEALSPSALLSFALSCPACGGQWTAPLDAVDLLWRELRGQAEQLLAEVALLARAWSWSEREILALTPVRRAAYLQLLQA